MMSSDLNTSAPLPSSSAAAAASTSSASTSSAAMTSTGKALATAGAVPGTPAAATTAAAVSAFARPPPPAAATSATATAVSAAATSTPSFPPKPSSALPPSSMSQLTPSAASAPPGLFVSTPPPLDPSLDIRLELPKEVPSLSIPFTFGTVAHYLGSRKTNEATHRWSVFVRGVGNPDLSHVIKKCVFTLHQSFLNPVREVLSYPFEVTENGWGEFEIGIRIEFHDENLPPMNFFHLLKLYPAANTTPSTKKPVVSEKYDEFVLFHPSARTMEMIKECPPAPSEPSAVSAYVSDWTDQQDLDAISSAQEFIDKEILEIKKEILRAEAEAKHLQDEIISLGGTSGT